ncbi:apolipoprotein D-like [Arctopsyche grandis]|uniref:apolipoprotein D-like n=1 Tax=Arctopsyche grandis TaxID=121162 RepID=UPI00406D7802
MVVDDMAYRKPWKSQPPSRLCAVNASGDIPHLNIHKMLRILLVLVVSIVASNGQLFKSGFCPTLPAVTSFDANKFSGLWYTVEQYPTIYETIARCPTIKYTYKSNGKFNIEQNQILLTNSSPISWVATGSFTDGPTVAKWTWSIPMIPSNILRIPYQVLGTDYSNYAVVYSCLNLFGNYMESLWIMTKNYPLLSFNSASASGRAVMKKYGLNSTMLIPAIQLFCIPNQNP